MDHAKSLIDLFIDQWDRVKLKKRHGLAKLIAWQKRAKLFIQPFNQAQILSNDYIGLVL